MSRQCPRCKLPKLFYDPVHMKWVCHTPQCRYEESGKKTVIKMIGMETI